MKWPVECLHPGQLHRSAGFLGCRPRRDGPGRRSCQILDWYENLLLEKIPPKKVTFADVSDRLQKMVIGQPKRILAPAYIRQLRREAAVGILDPKLRAEEEANKSAAAKAEKALEEFRAKKAAEAKDA